jgi:ABC-2 type transport system permease protein
VRKTGVIFRRELAAYFNSPIAYIFISFFLILVPALYLTQLFSLGRADMRLLFGWMPMLLLFFAPAITMRLWAEERASLTIEILQSLPFRPHQLILGKFLSAYAFLAIALVLTFPLPITLAILAKPDGGPILGGYLGALLLGGVYLSVGAFVSAATRNQIVAFVSALAICFALWMMSWPSVATAVPVLEPVFTGLGVLPHFENLERGVLALSDLVYFFSGMVFFLFLNLYTVERTKY